MEDKHSYKAQTLKQPNWYFIQKIKRLFSG